MKKFVALSYGCCDVCDLKIVLKYWSLVICYARFIGGVTWVCCKTAVKYEDVRVLITFSWNRHHKFFNFTSFSFLRSSLGSWRREINWTLNSSDLLLLHVRIAVERVERFFLREISWVLCDLIVRHVLRLSFHLWGYFRIIALILLQISVLKCKNLLK